MTFKVKIFLFVFLLSAAAIRGQEYDRIAFYNVENYFDTEFDSTRNFNGFTPKGDHHWTVTRYSKKKRNIYKVIMALGKWQGVTLMGFAEIENFNVLKELIETTPLKDLGYGIIHYESPDKRGIDVGAIYLKDRFKLLYSKNIRVTDSTNPFFTTRDILYIKGIVRQDTVNVFFNHWPSRYGGMMNTVRLRKIAARTLIGAVDSLIKLNRETKIIILGDFNDNPDDESIKIITGYNNGKIIKALPAKFDYNNAKGTIKHNSSWAIFDQIFVTESLMNKGNIHIKDGKMSIFDIDFLFENDTKYGGLKLNRSFAGFKYHGGFSDHLPVYVDLIK